MKHAALVQPKDGLVEVPSSKKMEVKFGEGKEEVVFPWTLGLSDPSSLIFGLEKFSVKFGQPRIRESVFFKAFQAEMVTKYIYNSKLWLWTVHNSFACAYLADARFYKDVTCMLKYVTHFTGRSQISSFLCVLSKSLALPSVGSLPLWASVGRSSTRRLFFNCVESVNFQRKKISLRNGKCEPYPKFVPSCYLLYTGL